MARRRNLQGMPPEQVTVLKRSWRRFGWLATGMALLTAPAVFLWLRDEVGMNVGWAIFLTIMGVAAFRGVVDVVMHRYIPWASLLGITDDRQRREAASERRRWWFWRFWLRITLWILGILTAIFIVRRLIGGSHSWPDTVGWVFDGLGRAASNPQSYFYGVYIIFLFLANILLLLGPLVVMGARQMRRFEPGDADWGVKLEDVRGQKEAKAEIQKIVNLWQSGEIFEKSGGKRERGMLFHGAPGVGKTMLAKAVATSFNCPIVTMPGSGFAATFIGVDALTVWWLSIRARKLARKWGGQCIVFIDEIDAIGMRRGGVGGARYAPAQEAPAFHGRVGTKAPGGDLIAQSPEWQDYIFRAREPERRDWVPGLYRRVEAGMGMMVPGMMGMGGSLALNQLLVVMDGMDGPPRSKSFLVNRLNTFLDALYIVPTHAGRLVLRLPKPKPRKEQIYFIGATNVDLSYLDPALLRAGRMGRHVYFRTPTIADRKDIFDLYLGKVAHDPELDRPERREEISRLTGGYSPAMIDQVCSLALTYAQHEGREAFTWDDLIEAMVNREWGTSTGEENTGEGLWRVAVHEAGHAVAAHVYLADWDSIRLSVVRRGNTGGHHSAIKPEEKHLAMRSEQFAEIQWGLGAIAAEHVFFGENSQGVGGDLGSATMDAARMVGQWGMAPPRLPLGRELPADVTEEETRTRINERFEEIGRLLSSRVMTGPMDQNPYSSVLADRSKGAYVARVLGMAFLLDYHLIRHNKEKVAHIAEVLAEKKELFGNELVDLLNDAQLEIPTIDLLDEESWPKL
jgi:ATP-dependent Zn protease